MVASILNILTFITILILFFIHKCLWQRRYNKIRIKLNKKYLKLNRYSWNNK